MKKLLSLFAALAITATALPSVGVFAEEEKTAADHAEKTVTIGDVNNSGKLDIGDLVTASRFILGEEVEDISSMLLDVNFDGANDVFDLIQLRKLLISPENSKVQEYIMDIVKSLVRMNSENIKLENAEDAAEYFKNILSDSEEIKKFTDKYDEEFFKDNVLILRSYLQQSDNDLIFDFAESCYNSVKKCLEIDLENVLGDMSAETPDLYGDFGCVLAQVSLPKEMSNIIEDIKLFSLETADLPDDYSFLKPPSPDGDNELLAVFDDPFLFLSANVDGEEVRHDWGIDENEIIPNILGSFLDGEWSENERGKTFTDKDGNEIVWNDNFVELNGRQLMFS